jgi:hypothetical protein
MLHLHDCSPTGRRKFSQPLSNVNFATQFSQQTRRCVRRRSANADFCGHTSAAATNSITNPLHQ